MMKVLAIDFGDVRMGMAISDESGTFAFPRGIYQSQGRKKDLDFFLELCLDEKIRRVILSAPYNMDGSTGERFDKTLSFKKDLEKRFRYSKRLEHEIDVILWDERLTTQEALTITRKSGFSIKKTKQTLDALSAQILLENYLDSVREENKMDKEKDLFQVIEDEYDENMEVQEVELEDEDGNVTTFIIDEWFEYEDRVYAVMIDEDDEAVLFRVEEDEEGEMSFINPDEEEFAEVAKYYEEN